MCAFLSSKDSAKHKTYRANVLLPLIYILPHVRTNKSPYGLGSPSINYLNNQVAKGL